MSSILAVVRGGDRGDVRVRERAIRGSDEDRLPVSTTPIRRRSTADILAAARAQAAGGAGRKADASAVASSSAPVAPSKTVSILEAARRQGASGARASETPGTRPSQSIRPTSTGSQDVAALSEPDRDESLPRPASMASILKAVRERGTGVSCQETFSYPPLHEMLAELRRQDQLRRRAVLRDETSRPAASPGVVSLVLGWLGWRRSTHQGASF
jgi:hypothetical protein